VSYCLLYPEPNENIPRPGLLDNPLVDLRSIGDKLARLLNRITEDLKVLDTFRA
jgi:hypothetical protein